VFPTDLAIWQHSKEESKEKTLQKEAYVETQRQSDRGADHQPDWKELSPFRLEWQQPRRVHLLECLIHQFVGFTFRCTAGWKKYSRKSEDASKTIGRIKGPSSGHVKFPAEADGRRYGDKSGR
jgi:hypothetical protein